MRIENLPDPGQRFTLEHEIGGGVCAKVFRALDNDSGGRPVAIKIQRLEGEVKECINEEYRVLRDYSKHPNLPELLGVYRKPHKSGPDEIWFVMEYCEGGSVMDLIHALSNANRRLTETHVAFILRETAKALCHLHKSHVIHRDVRGSNILLTRTGEVKLIDFGMSKDTKTTYGKRGTCIGCPNWMAPEVITSSSKGEEVYNNRSDVWAMGITAIEIADGKPPFADMHPTRIIFQVVRNPPPTLYRQSNWSQTFNDFIAECLEKNADCRPVMEELMEHPFFTQLPENDYHLTQEIRMYLGELILDKPLPPFKEEVAIYKGLRKYYGKKPHKMFSEDLATVEKLTEDTILDEIHGRVKRGSCYTFVGDVLLAVNANETSIDSPAVHAKYKCKTRSENSPHIFAVADSAYQDMLHHEESQHILLGGESYSGKSHNLKLLIKHLQYLGEGYPAVADRINAAYSVIHAFTHAGSPTNPNSTRCVISSQMAYAQTGKLTGAIFWVYMLEKTRVTFDNPEHSNFHIFYYFYDAMEQEERLKDFSLDYGRTQTILRVSEHPVKSKLAYPRDNPDDNVRRFKELEQNMILLDFSSDQIETIYRILAAIIIIGELRFKAADNTPKFADLENPEYATEVAKLLKLDEKKFVWALVNYCVINEGRPERRRQSPGEARDARDTLANTIYCRLVDYIVNIINAKLALSRAIYGDLYTIDVMDMFGFECFSRNRYEQLMVNSLNEQLQYHYNQRIFVWEMIEQEEENIPVVQLHFYDNKLAVDHLLSKPNGIFSTIDEATRSRQTESYIIDAVNSMKSPYLKRSSNTYQFNVAHFTGSVTYDARDFSEKNRDFLPPEMVETLRTADDNTLKTMFTNLLSKTGNLTMESESEVKIPVNTQRKTSKWGAALVAEKSKTRKMNTLSKGQYSQTHKMRTLSSVYRATCLELLKSLSIGANSGGTHFVRCIRSDLENEPKGFMEELVRQQIRAMAILDTARARQRGFPYRIPFQEFLRRYKFLAFEFDENVEISKDNCRLLLIRLKMEGWVIGKSKVFLKYYNVEFLARLYETQVKKIVKVQSMMRAFLAKKSIAIKMKNLRQDSVKQKRLQSQASKDSMSEEEACIRIQKAYRGYSVRKKYGPLMNEKTGKIDIQTAIFINSFAKKWKSKSIFQVLLQYRAARYQDLVSFCQQVHFYNQRLVQGSTLTSHSVLLDRINPKEFQKEMLGTIRPMVLKIPYRYDLLPYFNTTYMCDPQQGDAYVKYDSDEEVWDAPLRRRKTTSSDIARSAYFNATETRYGFDDEGLVNEPFVRTPGSTIRKIAPRRFSEQNQNAGYMAYSATPSTSYRSNYVPNIYSPTPYHRTSVTDIRGRFNDDGMEMNGRAGVYKKKAAPQPPKPTSYQKYPAPQPGQQWEPKAKPEYSYEQRKVDPIKELEMIGRVRQDEDTNDSPPFNFQGMLRKTNHKRNSMKRVTDGSLSIAEGNNNFDIDGRSSNNVVFQSRTTDRPRSAQLSATSPVAQERKYSLQDTGAGSSADFNANRSSVQGLVLEEEGFSADL